MNEETLHGFGDDYDDSDPELKEAYENVVGETQEYDERKSKCIDFAGSIIENFNKRNNRQSETLRLFDVDEDTNTFESQWNPEASTLFVPIYNAIFEAKGTLTVRYLTDTKRYHFRIDDLKIAELIANGQLPKCLSYKNDEPDGLFFELVEDNVVNEYLDEYFSLIYDQRIDSIVSGSEDLDKKLEEIKRDSKAFCQYLMDKNLSIQFRALLNLILDGEGNFDFLLTLILWPETPCPIPSKLDNGDDNPERLSLIKTIRDLFFNDFLANLNSDSVLKAVSKKNSGEILHIYYRYEENKIPSRIEAALEDERDFIVFDTLRTDFGVSSEYSKWKRRIKTEAYGLGVELGKIVGNSLSFKLAFFNRVIDDTGESVDSINIIFTLNKDIGKTEEEVFQDLLEYKRKIIESNKERFPLLYSVLKHESKFRLIFCFDSREPKIREDYEAINTKIIYEHRAKVEN